MENQNFCKNNICLLCNNCIFRFYICRIQVLWQSADTGWKIFAHPHWAALQEQSNRNLEGRPSGALAMARAFLKLWFGDLLRVLLLRFSLYIPTEV